MGSTILGTTPVEEGAVATQHREIQEPANAKTVLKAEPEGIHTVSRICPSCSLVPVVVAVVAESLVVLVVPAAVA